MRKNITKSDKQFTKNYSSLANSTNFKHNLNTFNKRRSLIEDFIVIHPLLDRLMEIKMAKCLQHGHIRTHKSQWDLN